MNLQISCECGFALRSPALDELVRVARTHALEAHGLEISTELAVALSRPVPTEGAGTS